MKIEPLSRRGTCGCQSDPGHERLGNSINPEISRLIASTFLGDLRQSGNLGVAALYNSREIGGDYLTLSDALVQEELEVQEMSRNGSGPTLQVTNFSHLDVLVAEGEELSGQTHRKLLDRTVLLRAGSKTLMQVNPSDFIMANGFPRGLFREYLRPFSPLPGQRGVIVMVNGHVFAFEMYCNEVVYNHLHYKVLKNIAKAGLSRRGDNRNAEFWDKATQFFKAVSECEQMELPALGHGSAYRFEGAQLSGTALIADGQVIHLSFRNEFADTPYRGPKSLTQGRKEAKTQRFCGI